MDGLMGGWMAGKAGLRIAYSNQQIISKLLSKPLTTRILYNPCSWSSPVLFYFN
jgi:hypothetical protein